LCKAPSCDCMSSVTLVDQDHIGWKSWKLIIARTIRPTSSFFVAQRPSTYSQGNWGHLGETRGGVGKSGMLEHKSDNISERRKDISYRYYGGPYRNPRMLFRTVPSPTHTAAHSPKLGVRNPHPKFQSLLSQERVKLRTQISPVHLQGSPEWKPINNLGEKGAWAYPGTAHFLKYPLLSQERVQLWISNFVHTFTGSIGTKAH